MNLKKWGLFLGGALFGSAGIRILASKDAKNVYTKCAAAALRAKDAIVDQATILQENCEDIYEGAKSINEARYRAETVFEEEEPEDTISEEAVAQ